MSFQRYFVIALATFLGLLALSQLYARSAPLTCWSGGYARNAWMAYCNSDRYGVYDVDAIWFETESEVSADLAAAQVLTLSDSRLQSALSLGGASEWFADRGIKTYFLGLPTEQSGFGTLLVDKFKPHPRVVIFDASPYFTGELGGSESTILAEADSREKQVRELQQFQRMHIDLCKRFETLCGHNFSYFRSRLDGHWIFPEPSPRFWIGARSVPNDQNQFRTGWLPDELIPLYPKYREAAQALVAKLNLPPTCVIITHVPSDLAIDGLAKYLAQSLGATWIDPQLPGLVTFDKFHLSPSSSRRWTEAFLHAAEPVIRGCVSGT